jgi:hypothetical protein
VPEKLLFFPVDPAPLTMKAGLIRFPHDFGHGDADSRVFLVDDDLAHAVAEKRKGFAARRSFDRIETPDERRAADEVLAFVRARLADEAPDRLAAADADTGATSPFDALGRALQEDLVVMHAGQDGTGRAVLVHVSFPSGWRPEHVAGTSFREIHGPVPGFPGRTGDDAEVRAAAARSMMDAMIKRGPYVRFVWTVCADDALDHHPDSGLRAPKTHITHFRVERQLTWPFPDVAASLFVIRTFVYPIDALGAERARTLAEALANMPPEIRRYKGLDDEAIAKFVSKIRDF